jgi:hypothetical protein
MNHRQNSFLFLLKANLHLIGQSPFELVLAWYNWKLIEIFIVFKLRDLIIR